MACCPVLKVAATLLGAKQHFNKEKFQLAENLWSAHCSPFLIFKVFAARMRKLITARARKIIRTARMLTNARKDHSIPLNISGHWSWCGNNIGGSLAFSAERFLELHIVTKYFVGQLTTVDVFYSIHKAAVFNAEQLILGITASRYVKSLRVKGKLFPFLTSSNSILFRTFFLRWTDRLFKVSASLKFIILCKSWGQQHNDHVVVLTLKTVFTALPHVDSITNQLN